MRNVIRITSFQVLQINGMRMTVTFAIGNLNSTSPRVKNKKGPSKWVLRPSS